MSEKKSIASQTAPLTGIRVLDFSHILAGPFCTRLLADFGAEVVKVETGTRPDRTGVRKGPSDTGGRSDRPAPYLNTNRSKRSITINLKSEAGYALAARLAQTADVIVENFSAGVMGRLKLDYERLKPLNPGLIYVSMSGYGHSGPRQDWTSMNMNLQAYTGLMMATGSENDPPIAISNSWNDYIGGLHACVGIFEALSERARTGVGANLDLAQFECSVATFGALLVQSAVNRSVAPRMGNRSYQAAPQGVYRCAGEDQWCAISVQSDEQWRALVGAMGNPAWASDSRFETHVGRFQNHDEIDASIEGWSMKLEPTEVEKKVKAAGVPADRMRRISEVVKGQDASNAFVPLEDPKGGSMLVTGVPFRFSVSPILPPAPAPALGEHIGEVLKGWLNLSDQEIERIDQEGGLV
jgi:crotonobetainyl-CoA:carnitine CoA-transferase CaiB-like acyl-CoA transferase